MDLLKRIISVSFFILTLIWLGKAFFLGNYPDFNVFYGGLTAYLHGGNPYLNVEGSTMKFLYPPFALFFFFPLIFFARDIASVLWVAFSLVILLVSIVLLFKLVRRNIISNEFFILSGLACMMFPVKFNLGMGQFNNVNLLLITLFLYFYQEKKASFAGISFGLSILLKVFPLLFFPYLMFLRKWKIIFWSGGVIIAGLLIPYLFMKPEVINHFFSVSLIGTIKSWPLDYYNQALSGFIGRWLGRGELASIIKSIFLLAMFGLTALIFWLKRKQPSSLIGFAALLPLTLATLSFSWQHYFVLAIPTFILLYFHLKKRHAKIINYVVLGIAYLFISGNLSQPGSYNVIIQSHMLWGALLLWGMSLYEYKKYD